MSLLNHPLFTISSSYISSYKSASYKSIYSSYFSTFKKKDDTNIQEKPIFTRFMKKTTTILPGLKNHVNRLVPSVEKQPVNLKFSRLKQNEVDKLNKISEIKDNNKITQFNQFTIVSTLLEALKLNNIETPTKVQITAITSILNKKNIILAAQTGTGKTLAYLLPIITHLKNEEIEYSNSMRPKNPRSIILTPTRELCAQVLSVCKMLSHHVKLRCVSVSDKSYTQAEINSRLGQVDVLVATPSRLIELLENKSISLNNVSSLVLDEADTLFEESFRNECDQIIAFLQARPKPTSIKNSSFVSTTFPNASSCQFIFVSATLPKTFIKLAQKVVPDIALASVNLHSLPKKLKQEFPLVGRDDKLEMLEKIIGSPEFTEQTIIFCNSISSCRAVELHLLNKNFPVVGYHGDVPAMTRNSNFNKFIKGERTILVATDLGARGLDTTLVERVINFDFPQTPIEYIHRVGRTARNGRSGLAVSLVTKKDRSLAKSIERAIITSTPLDEMDNYDFTSLEANIENKEKVRLETEELEKKAELLEQKDGLDTSIDTGYGSGSFLSASLNAAKEENNFTFKKSKSSKPFGNKSSIPRSFGNKDRSSSGYDSSDKRKRNDKFKRSEKFTSTFKPKSGFGSKSKYSSKKGESYSQVTREKFFRSNSAKEKSDDRDKPDVKRFRKAAPGINIKSRVKYSTKRPPRRSTHSS